MQDGDGRLAGYRGASRCGESRRRSGLGCRHFGRCRRRDSSGAAHRSWCYRRGRGTRNNRRTRNRRRIGDRGRTRQCCGGSRAQRGLFARGSARRRARGLGCDSLPGDRFRCPRRRRGERRHRILDCGRRIRRARRPRTADRSRRGSPLRARRRTVLLGSMIGGRYLGGVAVGGVGRGNAVRPCQRQPQREGRSPDASTVCEQFAPDRDEVQPPLSAERLRAPGSQATTSQLPGR